MQKYLLSFIFISSFSVFAFAETGYIGNEKCDLLSVKGKKKEAALCYKKEAKENMEMINELRESYDPSSGIVLSGYTPKELKELHNKLEDNMAAIKKSCKDDECIASETRQVIHYFSQISLAKNAELYGEQKRKQ